MPTAQSRRQFLTALLSGAAAPSLGSAALLRAPQSSAAEPPPETTAVRLFKSENLCVPPQFVAEELLRAEGFTEIGYLGVPSGTQEHAMARGEIDIGLQYAWSFVAAIDAGEPLTLLSGGMVGCVEVFAKENVRGIPDLKGGSVGVPALGGTPHKLVTLMAADVGLDPAGDIRWVTPNRPNSSRFSRRERSTSSRLLRTAKSTLMRLRRPQVRVCGPGTLVTSSSILGWTGRGRSISVAF